MLRTSDALCSFAGSLDALSSRFSGGLGWGGNMRFRTGLNLIDLTAEVSRRLEHVKFPFLIMHDPGDSECLLWVRCHSVGFLPLACYHLVYFRV